jgi:hypothetical protein
MLIWLVSGIFAHMGVLGPAAATASVVSTVMLFFLFFLLGWKVFGFMFQG